MKKVVMLMLVFQLTVLGAPTYERTADPNIIKQTETVESEIVYSILERQIAKLEAEISSYPDEVDIPEDASVDVREAIYVFNEVAANQKIKDELTEVLNAKKALKATIDNLPAYTPAE